MPTLTIQPNAAAGQDTFVFEGIPDNTYPNEATLDMIGWPAIRKFAYLKFDLSSLPVGAIVSAATLHLYGTDGGVDDTIHAYRVLPANATWTNAATWNHTNGVNRWAGDAGQNGGSDAGGQTISTDYATTQIGSVAFNSGNGADNVMALDLTEFAAMCANNHGFTLHRAAESATSVQPASSDNNAAIRPKLVITYTLPATMPATPRYWGHF